MRVLDRYNMVKCVFIIPKVVLATCAATYFY